MYENEMKIKGWREAHRRINRDMVASNPDYWSKKPPCPDAEPYVPTDDDHKGYAAWVERKVRRYVAWQISDIDDFDTWAKTEGSDCE